MPQKWTYQVGRVHRLLLPPAVVGDLMNVELLDDLSDLLTLTQQHFRFSRLGDDLFRFVMPSCHFRPPSTRPDPSSVSGPISTVRSPEKLSQDCTG